MDRARTFEIGDCLGRGGFGEVYRATMRTVGGLQSDVAVKVLRRDIDANGDALQRLRDEGRLLARLDHPVILDVHDLVLLEGRVALVTEFVDGQDLAAVMRGRDRIGVRALLEVVAGVGHALDVAWNAPLRDGTPLNLVHRDIKPSNIRLGRHGEVKLLDFGIARADTLAREARTQTDMMVGTPSYMAPERFQSSTVTPASDVFALAAALYEGLVGRRFYGRMDVPRIAGLVLDAESFDRHLAAAVGRVRDRCGDELADLVESGLLRDVEQRVTARQLADRAEGIAHRLDGEPLGRWCRSRSWPQVEPDLGEMSGRTVTETLVDAPRPSDEFVSADVSVSRFVHSTHETADLPLDAEPRGTGPGIAGLIVAALGILGLGAVGLAAGAGLAFNLGLGGLLQAPAEPTPQPPVSGEPDQDIPSDAAPEPQLPAPRAPETPDPQPEPSPAPAPRPAPAPMGEVRVDGPTAVELRSGARVASAGSVPAGDWEIHADFGSGMQLAGAVDVSAGTTSVISCNALLEKCEVNP